MTHDMNCVIASGSATLQQLHLAHLHRQQLTFRHSQLQAAAAAAAIAGPQVAQSSDSP